MTVTVLSLEQTSADVQRGWSDLAAAGGLNPSLLFPWTQVIAETLAREEDVRVLTVTDSDDRLVGVVPHFHSRRRMLKIPVDTLQLTSNLVSYHAELVADDLGSMLEMLFANNPDTHVFEISGLVQEGPTHAELRAFCSARDLELMEYAGSASPYLTISGSFDEYLASKRKKVRYKFRQRARALEANDSLSLSSHRSIDDVDSLIESIVAIETHSWKRDAGINIGPEGAEIRYYRALLPMLARENALLAFVLRDDGRPISYNLCCVWGEWVGNLKTSYDSRFAHHSPGALVLDTAMRRAFDLGAREFDFLGNADPYKMTWASGVRSHIDCFVYSRHPRARFISAARALKRRLAPEPQPEGSA